MTQYTPLETLAMLQFECLPLFQTSGKRESSARQRKRDRVLRTTNAFLKVIHEHPELTRDEAIKLTLGSLALFLKFILPWVGFAITVVDWLYDFYTEDNMKAYE